MTLRSKLLAAQAPLVLALILLSIIGSIITSSLGKGAQRILTDNFRSVLAAQQMNESLERMNNGALFLIAGDEPAATGFLALHRPKFEQELRAQENNLTEAGELELTQRLRTRWAAYEQTLEQFLSAPPTSRSGIYFRELLPLFQQTKAATQAILSLNQDAMARKSNEAAQTARRFDSILIAFAIAGCLLALFGSTKLTTRLLRPVTILGHAARRIGEGDLAARARVEGKDEIAQLSREFNTMADKLQQYRQSSLGELLEAQQASQAAIDSLPDPVIVLATDGEVLHVNVAAESTLKVNLDKGSKGALLNLDPVARDVVERMHQHVVTGKGPFSPKGLEESFRLSTTEGERHFLPRATPVYSEEGAVIGATVVLQDVTRLQRFDELKNNLVATVAHEFRTPLTSLQMAIHLCAEQIVGSLNDKQLELLYAAREDCGRLQSIVEELLDLSRIQAGRVDLHLENLEMEALVKKALEGHESAAAQRHIKLHSEVLPGSGHVQADAERVQLIFGNLVANAIRHSPENSVIAVRANVRGDQARFEVTDSGPGIPHEYQQAIFEKFFRMPGGPSGTAGLGLFIAKELVQAHGGDIGVTSEPGRGSTFWFTLPLSSGGAAGHA